MVVEEVVVVDDDVVEDDVDDVVVVLAGFRFNESGLAVNSGWAFTPSRAFFMTSEKICAGNDPPVTPRCPWTLAHRPAGRSRPRRGRPAAGV